MREHLYNLATDKYKGIVPGLIKIALLLLSFIYGLAVRVLIFLKRIKPYRLACRVISVGNITVGGAGKTCLVEFFARSLKQDGFKVAILTRGYRRKKKTAGFSADDYKTMGDEPYMLRRKLPDIPVIVDTNRIRAAKRAMKEYAVDTVLLDDGFQQWHIKKDSEIVAVNATDPFGNRHLLPRGILRQPLSSLKQADIIVLTKTNLNPDIQDIKDFLIRINPQAKIFESVHRPAGFYRLGRSNGVISPQQLKGKIVTLVCGIGDPDSFENLIASLGINAGLSFRFPDHHDYTKEDLEKIMKSSRDKNIDTIITTEKDASRLSLSLLPAACSLANLLVLRIELEITKR